MRRACWLPDMAQKPAVTTSARLVFAVLRLIAAEKTSLGVSEISRRLDVPVNKAYRAAVTLEDAGYLKRQARGRGFEIGPAAERLVYAGFQQFPIRTAISPYLRQLATSAEATASLAVRVGWYAITVAYAEGGRGVVPRARRLGRAVLLNEEAGGLAILGGLKPSDVRRFQSFASKRGGAHRGTSKTNKPAKAVRFGVSMSIANNEQLYALAIPLRAGDSQPLASITVEAPVTRDVSLEADPLLKDWLQIVAEAEATLRTHPEKFAAPYAALDPDNIDFS
jgi:DNA-binding IclR family transcriptional regulator